jgi:hypothetical protein
MMMMMMILLLPPWPGLTLMTGFDLSRPGSGFLNLLMAHDEELEALDRGLFDHDDDDDNDDDDDYDDDPPAAPLAGSDCDWLRPA